MKQLSPNLYRIEYISKKLDRDDGPYFVTSIHKIATIKATRITDAILKVCKACSVKIENITGISLLTTDEIIF